MPDVWQSFSKHSRTSWAANSSHRISGEESQAFSNFSARCLPSELETKLRDPMSRTGQEKSEERLSSVDREKIDTLNFLAKMCFMSPHQVFVLRSGSSGSVWTEVHSRCCKYHNVLVQLTMSLDKPWGKQGPVRFQWSSIHDRSQLLIICQPLIMSVLSLEITSAGSSTLGVTMPAPHLLPRPSVGPCLPSASPSTTSSQAFLPGSGAKALASARLPRAPCALAAWWRSPPWSSPSRRAWTSWGPPCSWPPAPWRTAPRTSSSSGRRWQQRPNACRRRCRTTRRPCSSSLRWWTGCRRSSSPPGLRSARRLQSLSRTERPGKAQRLVHLWSTNPGVLSPRFLPPPPPPAPSAASWKLPPPHACPCHAAARRKRRWGAEPHLYHKRNPLISKQSSILSLTAWMSPRRRTRLWKEVAQTRGRGGGRRRREGCECPGSGLLGSFRPSLQNGRLQNSLSGSRRSFPTFGCIVQFSPTVSFRSSLISRFLTSSPATLHTWSPHFLVSWSLSSFTSSQSVNVCVSPPHICSFICALFIFSPLGSDYKEKRDHRGDFYCPGDSWRPGWPKWYRLYTLLCIYFKLKLLS